MTFSASAAAAAIASTDADAASTPLFPVVQFALHFVRMNVGLPFHVPSLAPPLNMPSVLELVSTFDEAPLAVIIKLCCHEQSSALQLSLSLCSLLAKIG